MARRLSEEHLVERGLAEARLPADQHQPATPRQRRRKGVAQVRPLALAIDERWGGEFEDRASKLVGHRGPHGLTVGTGGAEYSTRRPMRCRANVDTRLAST
ncbi:MAG: hypothetical protein AVDCRST_MAG88-1305 [uncultured Thermomicrobiales bacterium]|uniref:Uncharacterized protein n=1 Tax=uncultured Thermomicrobiales bacterium TaxID=1645740 RepID=A0A6J4USJ8_9BACT|nr:MAG: hypothetical protein AVDCRST_MAG88-1305 [uncultured Thermomicrobiales bacterium]